MLPLSARPVKGHVLMWPRPQPGPPPGGALPAPLWPGSPPSSLRLAAALPCWRPAWEQCLHARALLHFLQPAVRRWQELEQGQRDAILVSYLAVGSWPQTALQVTVAMLLPRLLSRQGLLCAASALRSRPTRSPFQLEDAHQGPSRQSSSVAPWLGVRILPLHSGFLSFSCCRTSQRALAAALGTRRSLAWEEAKGRLEARAA